jgi:hypothetical protein
VTAPDERRARAAVAIVTAAGLAQRAALLPGLGFHSDEGIFVVTASQPTLLEVWRATLENPHPPGQFFLLHLLLHLSWQPWVLKGASLVAGTACIPLAFALGRRLLGAPAGVAMAVLVAFSPGLVDLSVVARNYAVGFALLLASLLGLEGVLRGPRRAPLAAFAGFELLAASFHYGFLPVFLGSNLVLFASLLAQRRPPRQLVAAAAAQLPVAAFFLFSYLVHVAPRRGEFSDTAAVTYHEQLTVAPRGEWLPALQGWLHPLAGVCDYLGGSAGTWLLAAAALGAAWLAWHRRWRALALLLAPFPFAYASMLAGVTPLGGIRHSAYLFPSLFGLAAACAQALAGVGAASRRPATSVAVGAALAGLALAFAALSLHRQLEGIRTDHGLVPGIVRLTGVETPTRLRDVREVGRLLREEVGEQDVVLASYASLLTLRAQLDPQPLPYGLRRPASFVYHGREVAYRPVVGWSFSAGRFVDALRDLAREREIPARGRIWVLRSGWELYAFSPGELLALVYPDASQEPWLLDLLNERGQALATAIDARVALRLERVPDPLEDALTQRYLEWRLAGRPAGARAAARAPAAD